MKNQTFCFYFNINRQIYARDILSFNHYFPCLFIPISSENKTDTKILGKSHQKNIHPSHTSTDCLTWCRYLLRYTHTFPQHLPFNFLLPLNFSLFPLSLSLEKEKEKKQQKRERRNQKGNKRKMKINVSGLKKADCPTLRANPFPKVTDLVCRIPLTTFFYRLEAIHLEDLLRLSVRFNVKINYTQNTQKFDFLYALFFVHSVPWSFMGP